MNIFISLNLIGQAIIILAILSVVFAWSSVRLPSKAYSIPVWVISFVSMLLLCLYENLMFLQGLLWLALMIVAGICYQQKIYRLYATFILLVLGFMLAIHALPGFSSFLLIGNAQISSDAFSYSRSFAIDKFSAGLIIFWFVFTDRQRVTFNKRVLMAMLPIAVLTILLVLALANFSLVRLDVKFSSVIFIAALANLFFTCMIEEAYFRGLIQQNIEAKLNYRYAIIISALLFGVAHYATGRWDYVAVAVIAGIGYATVYYKTRSIGASILSHWLLNMTHMVFFTYPFLVV